MRRFDFRWVPLAIAAFALPSVAAHFLLAAPSPPVGEPAFSVAGLSVEGDLLVIKFKTTMPAGSYATWDPDAAAKGVARLVTLESGKWGWATYTPVLQGVNPPPPPPPPDRLIQSFTVGPETIKKGDKSTLAWSCPKAKAVTVNGLPVALQGSQDVTPTVTTTYTLTATADGRQPETAQRVVTVTDTPPPIPDLGLRVLIVEEKTDRGTLAPAQVEILTSTAAGGVLDYLAKNCVQVAGVPEWRLIDKDMSFERETDVWKKARAKFDELKVPVPGWLVSDGVSGIASALPSSPAEALKVLKEHTPAKKTGTRK